MQPTTPVPFTPEMEAAYARAKAKLDPARLKQLLFDITDIHSPTGATRNAAEFGGGAHGQHWSCPQARSDDADLVQRAGRKARDRRRGHLAALRAHRHTSGRR